MSRTLLHKALLCSFLALFLTACDDSDGANATVAEHLGKAESYLHDGQARAALIELRNAAKAAPDNVEVQLGIARVYTAMGGFSLAEATLEKLWKDEKNRTPAVALARKLLKFEAGDLEAVLDEPLGINSELTPAQRATYLGITGLAQMALGRRAEAVQSVAEAQGLDAKNLYVLSGTLRLAEFAVPPDTDRVDGILNSMRELAPNHHVTLRAAATIAAARRDFDTAAATFTKLAELYQNPLHLLAVARNHIAGKKNDKALAMLTEAEKRLPRHPVLHYLRALAALGMKDYEQVRTSAELALGIFPEHQQSRFLAGSANFALKDFDQAVKYLSGYVDDVPNDDRAKRMFAAALVQAGNLDLALEVFEELDSQNGLDFQSLSLAGAAAAKAGKLRESRDLLGRAVEMNEDNALLKSQLGAVEMSLGNADEGLRLLEDALAMDPTNLRISTTLINAYLQRKTHDQAIDLARSVQEAFPDHEVGFVLEGVAWAAKKDRDKARAAFSKALAVNPKSASSHVSLVRLSLEDRDLAGARSAAEEGLRALPDHQELSLRLARIALAEKKADEATGILERVISQHPDNAEARIAVARMYLSGRQPQRVLDVIRPLTTGESPSITALDLAAQSQLLLKDGEGAARTFARLTTLQPENGAVWFGLAQAYALLNDRSAEINALQETVKRAPKLRTAVFRLIDRLVAERSFFEAREYLRAAREDLPDRPELDTAEGIILLGEGKPTEAIPLLEKALAGQETPAQKSLMLLEAALWRAGEEERALSTLAAYLDKKPEDHTARLQLGLRYLTLKRYDTAIATFRALIERVPKHIAALNNLAWTLSESGQHEEALEMGERSLALAPNSPPIKDTVAVILMRLNRMDRAETLLEDAHIRAPRHLGIAFHYAQALVGRGKKRQAVDVLEPILADGRPFGERQAAIDLLNSLRTDN